MARESIDPPRSNVDIADLIRVIRQSEQVVDFAEIINIVRKRFWIIILCTLIVVGGTALYTIRQTKIYKATATLQIDTQAPRVLGEEVEDVVTLGTGSYWANQEYYGTQYKIIASREVAERVVRSLKLNEDMDFLNVPPEERAGFEPASMEAAAMSLQSKLQVEPVKDSRLVDISILDHNPARAQLLVNAVADAYIDQNLEQMLSSTVGALDWLSNQMEELRGKLERSEDALYSFKKEHGILSVDLEDRQNILANEIQQFTTSLANVRAQRIELAARRTQMKKISQSDDPLSMPVEVLNDNPLIQRLKEQYSSLQQQQGELKERYLKNHPRVIEAQAKLTRIEGDIKREVRNILSAVDLEYETYLRNEAGLKSVLNDLKKQAQELGQKEIEYNRLLREKINNERLYQLVLSRAKETDITRLLRVNNIRVMDSATLPKVPIKPRVNLNILISILVGLALGIGIAFLLEYLDRTIKTQEQIEDLGLTFLGVLPSITAGSEHPEYSTKGHRKKKKKHRMPKSMSQADKDMVVYHFPKSAVAESCRAIRTNILFKSPDDPVHNILVTSPSPREGKTTVAVNLAITMAQSGSSVLVVDTDMRRPRLHKAVGISKDTGLSHAIMGEVDIEDAISSTKVENLFVLPSGPPPPNPAELLHTDSFLQVIRKLATMFDKIIFDSPPLGVVTDAAILSRLVDGTMIVVKPNYTTKEAARYVVSTLKEIGSPILGAVLNDLDPGNPTYNRYYYYYYHKGDYYESDETDLSDHTSSRTGEDRPQAH